MTDAGPLTGGPYPLTVSQRDSDNNSMNYRHSFIILTALGSLLWPLRTLGADITSPVPGCKPFVGEILREGEEGPEIRAPLVQTPPVLDGVLDDACWKGAFCCTGFYRPDWNKPATEQTFAYLCYDKENIYIGFYCKDSQPEKIYARETKRGGRIRRDDNVAVMLDVQHQHREQYSFRVTPRGTQDETIPMGSAAKVEWRGDWLAAGRIVKDGWIAEMAIPFKILRYPRGQSTFGICFARNLERADEWSSWPRMEDRFESRRFASWVDIKTPNITHAPLFMPYTQVEADEKHVGIISGLDMKSTLPNGTVVVATVNPDFRNVEQAVLGIDFSYVEKQQPEARPFFLEGEWGNPRRELFYSQRIEQVDLGIKAFGRVGKQSFSFLDTINVGDRNDLMMRYGYDFSDYDGATVALVHRAETGQHNLVGSFEFGHYHPIGSGGVSVGVGRLQSRTSGVGGDGYAQGLELSRNLGTNRLSANLSYQEVSPDFTSLDGYVPEEDFRSLSFGVSKRREWDKGPWERYGWSIGASKSKRFNGDLFERKFSTFGWFRLRNGTGAHVGYSSNKRPPDNNRTWSAGYTWGRNSFNERGGFGVTLGRQGGGDYRFFSINQGLEVTQDFQLNLRYQYYRLAQPAEPVEKREQLVLSGNYDITSERGYGFRLVMQDDKYNFYTSYRQSVRRGLDLFIILGDPNAETSRARLAIKAVSTY